MFTGNLSVCLPISNYAERYKYSMWNCKSYLRKREVGFQSSFQNCW